MSTNSNSKNKKKRSLKEMQNDDENENETNETMESPSPNKKRRMNENETTTKKKEVKEEEEEEDEDDDLKQNSKNKKEDAEQIKIVCYNLNGVRAAAKKELEEYIEEEDGDIVCFSEMKATSKQNPCKFRGYEVIWYECTEKAGYAGTAILSKTKPLSITKGIGAEDKQGRAITLEFNKFYLVNTYVPNSGQNLKFKERRLKWDVKMNEWIKKLQEKKPVIWTGDLNVAILDFDVYDGETNKKRCKSPGFTPYERENFRNLLSENNMVDSYRHFYPDERKNHYTFFTARSRGTNMKTANKGWRLDYFICSKSLMNIIDDVQIRRDKGCSDHVPLVLTMKDPDTALC